jgi:hypothetical protein
VIWQTGLAQTFGNLALALEYESVDKREGRKIGIPDFAIDDIVNTLCRVGRHNPIHFRPRPELTYPDDDFLLEFAFVARCDFIITHNMKHLGAARRFGISREEFLPATLAQQFDGLTWLKQRSECADDEKFKAALNLIPDVEPEDSDRL